jgi:long-chain fatty acid transport protein
MDSVYKKSLRFLPIFLSAFSLSSLASNFQDFSGITYSNPAELTLMVQDSQLILGDLYMPEAPHINFTGTVTVPDLYGGPPVVSTGNSQNTDFTHFPYGRIAKRLFKQWVIGLDVTKPFSSDIIFPSDSSVRYSVTTSAMKSTDVAPNIAYQFSGPLSNLSLGAGLDYMYYSIGLNADYPSFPSPTSAFGSGSDLFITNHASNEAWGWHVGALYHLFAPTFIGLSYFSEVRQHFTGGTSTFTGFPDSDSFTTTLDLPATTNFSIMQMLSQQWSILFKIHYSQWSTLQQVVLGNMSGPSPTSVINLMYKDTWRFDLGTRYKMTPKWTVGALVGYDQTPTSDPYRTLALPGVDQYLVGALAEYKITKTAALQATYGHVFSGHAPFNNVDPNTGITTVGNASIYGNAVGLQLTINT